MALEYDLHLARGLDAASLLGAIAETEGFKVSGELFVGPGLTGGVYADSKTRFDIIQEGFGLDTEFLIGMRVDLSVFTEEDCYIGVDTIIKLSLSVLARWPFDAVLLFNGESPVLLRKDGTLRLNKAKGFWRPKQLSLVQVPYVLEDLPSL